MAEMHSRGTCVPPGPSRYATGSPLTVRPSDGKWSRAADTSRPARSLIDVMRSILRRDAAIIRHS